MKRWRNVRNFKQWPRWRTALTVVGLLTAFPTVVRGQANSPGGAFEVFRGIPYVARGRTHLHADLYVPAGPGPFPAVLLVHGGGWVSGYREQMNHHATVLVKNGFVALSISYRLAPRFQFPDPLIDCRDALTWFVENADRYQIDTGRLAGFGYSAGAQLVCLLGYEGKLQGDQRAGEQEVPVRLRALVAGGTPSDLADGIRFAILVPIYLGGTYDRFPERYRRASPVTHLSANCPPTFFYHGDVDHMVPAQGVRAMNHQLRELGVRSEVYWVAGKGHIGAFADTMAIQRAADFLSDVLGPARDAPANQGGKDG
jgi:acetyl esterase/lipase